MMSDDNNQSSPSSVPAVDEQTTQPQPAEETAEDAIKAPPLTNGIAKKNNSQDPGHDEKSTNDDHPAGNNNNNNNMEDSLEAELVVAEEEKEERTYTSELLETCLVVKEVSAAAPETMHNGTVVSDEGDGQPSPEIIAGDAEATGLSVDESAGPVQANEVSAITPDELLVDLGSEVLAPMKSLEIPTPTDEEGDGFVPLAECLPHEEGEADPEEGNTAAEVEHKEIINGYGNHCSDPLPATPEPSVEEKANQPEMEQFVRSGGVKRIQVQKTEQPYSVCTTETKIAMEIREMREREEELRVMREQALLSPVISPVPPKSPMGGGRSPSPSVKECSSPTPAAGPGYRVSSVFGHKGTVSPSPPLLEERRTSFKVGSTESAVEREIRLAKDREEELRKQKGLPPREDDSYVKPSQVKSSQVRIFGKPVSSVSVKQAATAKIQLEIEEQTQREMALREVGSIQTISQERTDAKVTKINTPDSAAPVTNGSSPVNGSFFNGRHSPDDAPYKRGSPSPNGGVASRPASIFGSSHTNGKGVSMQKFIATKGREFSTTPPPKNGGYIPPREENKMAAVPPTMVKLKRTVSVESKIQQEIMEMKQREEELKKLHMNKTNGNDEREMEMNHKNILEDFENGNGLIHEEDLSPRHNKLIAQWEQRCQKTES